MKGKEDMEFLKTINFYNAKTNLEKIKENNKLNSAESIVVGRCLSLIYLFSTEMGLTKTKFSLKNNWLKILIDFDISKDEILEFNLTNEGRNNFRLIDDGSDTAEFDVDHFLQKINLELTDGNKVYTLSDAESGDRPRNLAIQLELLFSKYIFNSKGLFAIGTSLKLNEARDDFEVDSVGGLTILLKDEIAQASQKQLDAIIKILEGLTPISKLIKDLEEDSSLLIYNIREDFKRIDEM